MGRGLIFFLDASAVIYAVESAERFAPAVRARLSAWRRSAAGARVAISRLTWLEARVRPLREGDTETLRAFDAFFSAQGVEWIEVTRPVVELATAIRARVGLRTPDALQAASCLSMRGEHRFLTGDRGFRRVHGLSVELLGIA